MKKGVSLMKEDFSKLEEGVEKFTDWLSNFLEEEVVRCKTLIEWLLPFLKEETIDIMVQCEKDFNKESSKDDLLYRRMANIINHFDCNFHWMKEDDILDIADVLNENPLEDFFVSEE